MKWYEMMRRHLNFSTICVVLSASALVFACAPTAFAQNDLQPSSIEDAADQVVDPIASDAPTSSSQDGSATIVGSQAIVQPDDEGLGSQAESHVPPIAGNHTISWANSAAEAKEWFDDEQAVLANGTAEVVSVELDDGMKLSAADLSTKTENDEAYYLKGVLCAPTGSTVTMKLTPARGYQLLASSVNGGVVPLTALGEDDKIGQFLFEMPEEGLALDCGFAAASDSVKVSGAKGVTAGTISCADDAVSSGTLQLVVKGLEDADAKKALAAKASAASSVVAYLDLALGNVVNRGDASDAWSTPVSELSSEATVTLSLSDSVVSGATSFYVIREHGGAYDRLEASYSSSDKTVTFKTNKFSNYAVVKGVSSTASSSSRTSTSTTATRSPSAATASRNAATAGSATPKTGDVLATEPFVASALLSGGIAVFALRRLRRS